MLDRPQSKEDLLRVTDSHRCVVHEVAPGAVDALGLQREGSWAVTWVRRHPIHGINVDVLADRPETGHALMADPDFDDFAARAGGDGLTLWRGLADHPPAWVGELTGWEWMCTRAEPPALPATLREIPVLDCHPGDADELTRFLQAHNPISDGRPFAWDGQTWVAVRDSTGELVAVGCSSGSPAGSPYLSGITVHAENRGTGLGRVISTVLTRRALASHGVCTLEMYSVNTAARALYRSLGYGETVEWSSGGIRRHVLR